MSAVFSGLVLTLVLGAFPAAATVPGANGLIAFSTARDGNEEVYVMSPDGSGLTNLTNAAGFDSDPAWSPDGTRIAFSSDGEVAVMNADGSGKTNLTNEPSYDFDPTWSPDGSRIAFATDRDGYFEIYAMNADGSGQVNLTNTPNVYDFGPAWSPDGAKIAFQTNRDRDVEIYVMNPDGSQPMNLTRNAKRTDSDPAWSPDGARIAYSTAGADSEVFVMNADGTGPTDLSNNHAASDSDPAWSPDGTRVAFASFRQPNEYSIKVMNADGTGGLDELTIGTDFNRAPDWQSLPSSDLTLHLTATPDGATAQRLTYSITVENAGPSSAEGVVVTDVMPPETGFMSVTSSAGSCQAPPPRTTGTVVCRLDTLADDDSLVVHIIVRVNVKRGMITDTATVSSATPDPIEANNTASVTTQVG